MVSLSKCCKIYILLLIHIEIEGGKQSWSNADTHLASDFHDQISADNTEVTSVSKACVCVLTCKEENRSKIEAPEASSEQC